MQIVQNALWSGWQTAGDILTPPTFLSRDSARDSNGVMHGKSANQTLTLQQPSCGSLPLCTNLVVQATKSMQVCIALSSSLPRVTTADH